MTRRASLEILRVPRPPWQRRSGQETVLARFCVLRFETPHCTPNTRTLQQSTPSLHFTREQTDCKKQQRRMAQQNQLLHSMSCKSNSDCHLDRATDRADTALPELPEDDLMTIAGFGVGVTRPRARGTSWMSASSRKSASPFVSARSYSFACTAKQRLCKTQKHPNEATSSPHLALLVCIGFSCPPRRTETRSTTESPSES